MMKVTVRFSVSLAAAGLLATAALGQTAARIPEDALKQYRLAILKQASGVSSYPKDALELGIEGTAVVRLSIDAGGRITSSKVDPSSGYAVLDSAALEMVRKAHPLATLPPALRGRSFEAAVPVIFRMR
jgi:TonB family protein